MPARPVDIVDPETGKLKKTQTFVAVMGASNYTYAEATFSRQLEDWKFACDRAQPTLAGLWRRLF